MRTSDQLQKLPEALAKAQGEFKSIEKDRKNDHLGSKYSTIAAVIEVIREPLAKAGLSFVQPVTMNDGKPLVVTRLMHVSGEWIESQLELPVVQVGKLSVLQMMGVSITYARRYALISMLGLASDDTDGNVVGDDKGQPRGERGDRQREPPPENKPKVDSAQRIRDGVKKAEQLAAAVGGRAPADLAAELDKLGMTVVEPEKASRDDKLVVFKALGAICKKLQEQLATKPTPGPRPGYDTEGRRTSDWGGPSDTTGT